MSEPELIGNILPKVMRDIQDRCEANKEKDGHTENVLAAVGGFMSGRKPRRPRSCCAAK